MDIDWRFPHCTSTRNPVVMNDSIDTTDIPWRTPLSEGPSTAPLILDNTIYIGTSPTENTLYALQASDGAEHWSRTFDDWLSHVTTDGKTLYVSVSNATTHALDPTDGSVRWTQSFPKRGARASLPVDGTVYVSSAHGMLYALNSDDGSEQWHQWYDNCTPTAPAVGDDQVYISVAGTRGSEGGTVHAYGTDGSERWTFDVATGIEQGYEFGGVDPIIVDNLVFASSGTTVFALGKATGELRWEKSVVDDRRGKVETLCADSEQVYVANENGTIMAFDATTGAEQWRISRQYVGGPDLTLAEGKLYVSQFNDGITVYDAITGEVTARPVKSKGHFTGVTVHDGVLFFGFNEELNATGMCHARPLFDEPDE